MLRRFAPALAGIALVLAAPAAFAQTNKDTVRLAVYQPVPLIDTIYNPHPETSLIANPVFDSLVHFDAEKREYTPLLAKSWKRLDDKTYEFKLREGVKFHDGSPFSADDVVYSFDVYMDPKYNFRFKDTRFGWIDKVEKVDDMTVRIASKEPFAPFLDRLTANAPIYPAKIYRALENKGDFGRNPIGTGPYRVVSFDPAKGDVVYVKNDAYAMADIRQPAVIKNVRLSVDPRPADPDRQVVLRRARPRLQHRARHDPLAHRQPHAGGLGRAHRVLHLHPVRYARSHRHRGVQGQAGARSLAESHRSAAPDQGVPAAGAVEGPAAARHVPRLAHRLLGVGRRAIL